jgi:inorganic pyrophosphatase
MKKTRSVRESTKPITVVIETPKGNRNKIKFDPSSKSFKLSKIMPEGMMFPYDFGFVPNTRAADGDPIDVLVLTDDALFPGCRVDCRLVGVIEAEQKEKGKTDRNDRLIAVAVPSLLYSTIQTIDKIPETVLQQIKAFFVNYQKVRDVKVTILGTSGPERAAEALSQAKGKTAA